AAQKLNRLGPAVINKRFVCHRSVESHPIPQGNTYLSAYALKGGDRMSQRLSSIFSAERKSAASEAANLPP
ncbi:hypothetical protein, partial [Mesorhizobium sp. LSHC426A00]|uniref:hypothetical protein n=1 Tax=Mesorhizobium sp. LSHC426A00 TaxID=1287298 RepID=UPI001AEBD71C